MAPPSFVSQQGNSQAGPSGNGPSGGEAAPRPTFPAYQQPPSSENVASLPDAPSRPVSKVTPVGPGCKLIHPEDDLSLVSCGVASIYCIAVAILVRIISPLCSAVHAGMEPP